MPNELQLTGLTDDTYASFHTAIARGFHEQDRPEMAEFERPYMEFDRFFGFRDGDRWASTFGSFARTMTLPGGADVPVSAITVVTVQPPFRRRGLLTAMMQHELGLCVQRREPLAILWASEAPIYGRFGFGPAAARARLSADTRDLGFLPGVVITGRVDEVEPDAYVESVRGLWDTARRDRPGALARDEKWWKWDLFDLEFARDGASEQRYVLHHDDTGAVDGFATYRFKEQSSPAGPQGEVRVRGVWGANPQAQAGLWRYLIDLDLARTITSKSVSTDDGLQYLLANRRALLTQLGDNIYVRVIDVVAALEARRYASDLDVVLDVSDAQLPANEGRYRVRVSGGDATVERTEDPADIALGTLELGTVYLGGTTLSDLHRAGRISERTPGAVSAASAAFRGDRAPWCADDF